MIPAKRRKVRGLTGAQKEVDLEKQAELEKDPGHMLQQGQLLVWLVAVFVVGAGVGVSILYLNIMWQRGGKGGYSQEPH